jgi:hypothetical protein
LRFPRDLGVFEGYPFRPCLHDRCSLSCPSTPPQRLTPQLATLSGVLSRRQATEKSTSPELPCPSAFAEGRAPFSAPPVTGRRLRSFAPLLRSPVLRVWLPSRRRKAHLSSEASLSFQRSWALTLQSFSPAPGSEHLFKCPFRSCAFFQDLSASNRRFSGLNPPEQAVPSAARRIRSGRGLGSPGRHGSLGCSLQNGPHREHLPLDVPLSPLPKHGLTTAPRMDHGGFGPSRIGCLPPKRAPTRSTFRTDSLRDPLEDRSPADYFFISRPRSPYGDRATSS